MQIPFQYSLHIQNHKDEKLKIDDNHYAIANHLEDPRRSIAESMIQNFHPKARSGLQSII